MTMRPTVVNTKDRAEGMFRFFPGESTESKSPVAMTYAIAQSQTPTAVLWELLLASSDSVAQEMARRLRDVPSVERVFVLANSWGFEVWVEGANLAQEQRFRIYDAQWEMMQNWPKQGFGFHLHDRRDGALTGFLSLDRPYICIPVHAHADAI